jgi:putative heme iron utilization protein
MITEFKLFELKDNENWALVLDISNIWSDSLYESTNELVNFNNNYINFLNEQKDLISKSTSENSWNKLNELITKLSQNKNNLEKSTAIWDDIYDWGDENSVQILAQKETNKDF